MRNFRLHYNEGFRLLVVDRNDYNWALITENLGPGISVSFGGAFLKEGEIVHGCGRGISKGWGKTNNFKCEVCGDELEFKTD